MERDCHCDRRAHVHLFTSNSVPWRAGEESESALIRWLRPEFQCQSSPPTPSGTEEGETSISGESLPAKKGRSKVGPSRREGTTLGGNNGEGSTAGDGRRSGKRSGSSDRSGPERPTKGRSKLPWPKELAARTKAIQDALAAADVPITSADLAKRFLRARQDTVEDILTALVSLGLAHRQGSRKNAGGTYSA
jgi:hypothetical protein